MLDRLPSLARHLLLMLAATLLSWAGTEFVPWLHSQPGYGAFAGTLATGLIAYLTPLVRSYGVGSEPSETGA